MPFAEDNHVIKALTSDRTDQPFCMFATAIAQRLVGPVSRSSPRHVFCHGRLTDIDTKLEQLAVDPRSAPKRISEAHFPD